MKEKDVEQWKGTTHTHKKWFLSHQGICLNFMSKLLKAGEKKLKQFKKEEVVNLKDVVAVAIQN